MPTKFNDFGSNPNEILDNVPVVEKLEDKNNLALDDMMSNIIEEKEKIKNTSIMDMVGVLTPVDYYRVREDNIPNYNVDSNPATDIALETKKYDKIKNFRVKFNGNMDFSDEGDENGKSYVTSSSLIILPRTIKPNENDLFVIKYYGKYLAYRITTVNLKSFEEDSGFECEFTLYKENFIPDDNHIKKQYVYIHEMVGTKYRPILTPIEFKFLKNYKELYNHLSGVFNGLFYNRTMNGYFLKDFKPKVTVNKKNNTNIDGSEGRILRATVDHNPHENLKLNPRLITKEDIYYDNFLNFFISKNKIFRYFDGLMVVVENLLPFDRPCYKRSIFGCLETKSCAQYKNTHVSPIDITICQPGLPTFFVGKTSLIHLEGKPFIEEYEFIPKSLVSKLINIKGYDMTKSFKELVYNSLEAIIVDTIVRYVDNKTDDFNERFMYLFENLENLYEHQISYEAIYYLFPMLGYIIEQIIEKDFSDNTFQKNLNTQDKE